MSQRALALGVALLAAACAARSRPPDGGAGAFGVVVRESDVEVRRAFPGTWQWTTVFAPPDRYAWSLVTNDQPHHYLFDGRVVRSFVGDALVSEDAAASSPLRSQARFVAVTHLANAPDGLRVEPLPGGTGVRVVTADGSRYVATLDDAGRVRTVRGDVDLSPVAQGVLTVELDDYRAVGSRWLPWRIRYVLDGEELAVERVRRTCVLDAVPARAFAAPASLPGCAGPRTL